MNSDARQPVRGIRGRTAVGLTGVALTLALAGCAVASAVGPSTGSSVGTAPTSSSGAGTVKELDVCSLLPTDQASSLVGEALSTGVSSTIATGQDQCQYNSDSSVGLTVIVYQPSSGVSWSVLLDGSGADQPVSGVGDKAESDGAVELDVQSGDRLIAVQSSSDAGRIAVAKQLVGALK